MSAEGANSRDLERSRDHSSELARSLTSARSALEFCLVPWAYLWLDLPGPLDTSGPLDLKICAKGPSTSPRDRAKSERRRYRSKEPELIRLYYQLVKFADIRLVGKIIGIFFFKTCLENLLKKMLDF